MAVKNACTVILTQILFPNKCCNKTHVKMAYHKNGTGNLYACVSLCISHFYVISKAYFSIVDKTNSPKKKTRMHSMGEGGLPGGSAQGE